ncbi:hypothetical protein MIR68_002747 [Amoeboaphelidium protococcarum]|nr:hypothetical protein MIR68_002747 [Amoeboaphelidium protococcarum]
MVRKKKRTHKKEEDDDPNLKNVPKTFVIQTNKLTTSANQLLLDIRKVMEPNTAAKLKARRKNKLKDFVSVAGLMGVSHMMLLSQTDNSTSLRIAKSPKGPTLTFKIEQYALIRDIIACQAKPRSPGKEYSQAPLLVLNNFNSEDKHVKLMATMFQNLFPSLNLQKIHASDCRRIVLINYDKERKSVSFRHYYINVKIVGVSKSLKRIIQTDIPDLHKFEDISEYVLRDAVVSESDVEDAADKSLVTLPEKYVGQNNKQSQQRAIKLTEIGPRIDMKLRKIQDGFCDGEVIYHDVIKLTPAEAKEKHRKYQERIQLKKKRRQEQEANVERKKVKFDESVAQTSNAEESKGQEQPLSEDEEEVQSYSDEDSDIDQDTELPASDSEYEEED